VTTVQATSDLWWKNAVVYCLDVETFLDWNGDGIGDFPGLTQRVDYLAGIGVTCIWLMPFYPTPDRDDGYDITDFYGVDPRLGTIGDFVEFVRTARDRGIRVIADLVVNHTSDKHPWFRAARSSRRSPYRDYYIWADKPPQGGPKGVTFPDQETSLWQYDDRAGQYYLHRFYKYQPDLNVDNPKVRDEIAKVIGFWMQLGLSGFRVDAVPFLIEPTGLASDKTVSDPHDYLRDLRAFLSRRSGEGILLGEVNLEPKELRKFFGDEDGDELHMCFNFLVMEAMYLSLARQDTRPLERALKRLPAVPPDNQWASFVRNHDELTLDKLSDRERAEVFAAFGPEPEMQLYGRGLRRRLPSMLGGDMRRIRMVYSLLFSLPGTPVVFYGEEIGMGENLAVEGRSAVRTPMQWSDEKNAGFSTAAPSRLPAPVTEGEFGPLAVNVARERRDPDSLLNWMERLIRRRKETPEFGWGRWALVETAERTVIAHRCDWQDSTVVAVHNISSQPLATSFALSIADCEGLTDLLGDGDFIPTDGRRVEVKLDGYGYKWLRVRRKGQRGVP
jgi:trehalose synthase